MKKILIIIFLLSAFLGSYSQDKIYRKDGKKINCKIQKEDSSFIYFDLYNRGKIVQTYIEKSNVSSIEYNWYLKDSLEFEILTKGVGLGFDYGGFGLNVAVTPYQNIGLFGSVGFALVDFGYNVGARLNLNPRSKVNPYLIGMYGYNTVIYIKGISDYNKIFYNATLGFGMDFRSVKRKGFWSLALLFPIRKREVYDYINYLEDEKHVEFKNSLYPVAISIGYKY